MSYQASSAESCMLIVQVWTPLAADLRERAIRLMAQLAFNIVAAQPDSPIKEFNYDTPPEHTQDPT